MPEIYLYTTREVKTTARDPLSEAEFIALVKKHKPAAIWNRQYSSKQPLYEIVEYKTYRLRYFCNAWADKTPVWITFQTLYKRCKNGMTDKYFTLEEKQNEEFSTIQTQTNR